MIGRTKFLIPLIGLLVTMIVTPANLFAAGGVLSVQELLADKDRWPQMVGMPLQVEGYQTVLAKNYVKLKNCDLTFRSKSALPKLPGRSRVVTMSGRLAKDSDGKLYFEVESLRELTDDAETLRLKEKGLPKSPKAYFELADWAKARGEFYDDEELVERAKEINRKGVQLERDELQPVTPPALLALAERARERGLPESLQSEFRHDSFVLEWETLRKTAPAVDPEANELDRSRDPLFEFLKRLDAQFAGATEALKQPVPDFAKEYAVSPGGRYRDADGATRLLLHRLFHLDVATAAIHRWIKPDGSNGNEIADMIDQLTPEQHAVAEQHRDRELTFLAKNSAMLSRNQLQNLLERCRQRKQESLVKDAVQAWLKRREQSLRKDGVTGLIQMADDRWEFLKDQTGAAGFLLEALKETPQNADVTERLKNLGYQQINGEWKLPDATTSKPAEPAADETELERNIRLGIATLAMSPAEILRCLGTPSSVTRVASAGQVTETWTYREGAVVRQSVTISRQRGTAKVIAIR